MGKLLKTFLMPHPPIMIHEIARGKEEEINATVNASLAVADEINILKPETIVIVVPPHGPAFGDAISINIDNILEGSLGNFGAPNLKYSYAVDLELTKNIIDKCGCNNLPVVAIDKEIAKSYGISNKLDHGSMVPLHFINKVYKDFRIVHITYGLISKEELYKFGSIIRESIEESNSNAVFIASGDFSHRLTHDAPSGYNPLGKKFDSQLVDLLKIPSPDDILGIDKELIESAGECGYRSIIVMLGALDGYDVESNIYSYEGPFGVGYCIAGYKLITENKGKMKVETYFEAKMEKIQKARSMEDSYVTLARHGLEYYIKTGNMYRISTELPLEMLQNSAGVFVSIKKDNELRGCIGTIEAVHENIAEEIIQNSISAGTRDPRFNPIEEQELESLVYSVDVLGKPEAINSKEMLDPKNYGVIVRKGRKSGLLLPNLEGIDSVEEQLSIALKKAGINKDEGYSMERFQVIRHK